MRILVADPDAEQVAYAREMLAGHETVVARSFDMASYALECSADQHSGDRFLRHHTFAWLLKKQTGWQAHNPGSPTIEKFVRPGDWVVVGLAEVPDRIQAAIAEIWAELDACAAPKPFDVLLTSTLMEKGGEWRMSAEGSRLAKEQALAPYGPILALQALQWGVKLVGLLTAGDACDDPMTYGVERLSSFCLGNARFRLAGHVKCYIAREGLAPIGEPEDSRMATDTWSRIARGEYIAVKDWNGILEKLLS